MRRNRYRGLGSAALLVAAFAVGGAGCATAAPYNPGQLAPSDHAQVAGLCARVMGISPGGRQFDACLESLSSTVRAEAQGRALQQGRSACLQQGLAPGSAAFDHCELVRSQAATAGAPSPVLADALGPPIAPRRPYWAANNAEVRRREEGACSRLGLEPAGRAFAQCVAQLDSALFAANNPSH